jgi:hypothetical protein
MVVRVRIRWERIGRRHGARGGVFAPAFGQGLNLATAVAFLLALWRLGDDLYWTQRFALPQGVFSHWQLWLALAVLLQVVAMILQRHSRGGGAAMP